jgi:hypothetical protein
MDIPSRRFLLSKPDYSCADGRRVSRVLLDFFVEAASVVILCQASTAAPLAAGPGSETIGATAIASRRMTDAQ